MKKLFKVFKRKKHPQTYSENTRHLTEQERDSFFELSVSLMGVLGFDGMFKQVNAAVVQLLGYSKAEILATPFIEFVYPDDRIKLMEAVKKLATGARTFEVEVRVLCKSDTCRWVIWNGSPVESQGIFYAAGIDITDRKIFEETLQSSETTKSAILESALDAIITMDSSGCIVEYNQAAQQFFGYSRQEVIGCQMSELIVPPRLREQHRNGFKRFLETGQSRILGKRVEVQAMRKDGTEFPAELAIAMITLEGKPFFTSTIRDITDRKKAEERLRQSDERYNLALGGSNDGIWDWNIETGELFWSNNMFKNVGYEYNEVQPTLELFQTMLHSDDAEVFWSCVTNHLESGSQFRVEHRMKCKDGQYRWYRANGLAIRDGNGKPIRMAGSCTDIHESKLAEQKLLEAKTAAEEAHQQLAAANRELKVSIERANAMALEADTANRSKSLFLANMSHEIRTPLNGITGMTGLLLDENLSAEQKEYADTIMICSETLLALINDILDLSKIEAEKFELERRDFNLKQSVENTVNMLAMKAYEKGLVFGCQTDEGIPEFVSGDEARLRQILINLIGNAIKFTDFGEVSVKVKLESDDQTKLRLKFSVSDTGIGISEDKIGKLFQAFSQVDPSHTRKYGGTGLGLAISKKLVDMMNGTIGAKSVVNEGTVFWFCVEFDKSESENSSLSQENAKAIRKVNLPKLRVLVVEDNIINQKVAIGILRKYGLSCETAQNGIEALKMLSKASYDLILMDIQMPELDGLEATKKIRRQEQSTRKHLPIIAMTAHAMKGDREKCIEAGMDDYITKPVNPEELYHAIQNCVLKQNSALSFYQSTLSMDKKLFDSMQLMERIGKNEEIFQELVELFFEDSDERIKVMQEAIVQRDILTLLKAAHALKGSSANMGSQTISELCTELESACHENLMLRAETLAGELTKEYDKFKQILTSQMLNSGTPQSLLAGYQ